MRRISRSVGRRVLKRAPARPRHTPAGDLRGVVDSPTSPELWRAVPVTFTGWALDGADQVQQVDVIVGNNAPVHANTGLSPPDIPVHLGDPTVSAWSGWRAAVDLHAWPDDTVPVRVIATGAAAAAAVILDT